MYRVELLDVIGVVYETYGGFETLDEALRWADSQGFAFSSYQIAKDDESESNQFDTDMVKALGGILCDINPTEIASQIARDNLGKWCETIRTEILKEVQK